MAQHPLVVDRRNRSVPCPICGVRGLIILYSRVALAAQGAFQFMTMTSLLAWRCTSRDNYIQVAYELRSSLVTLVARFFPNPYDFINSLSPWGALIVGDAALSHVLHEPSMCNATFELAVGSTYFESFVDNMSRLFPVGSALESHIDRPAPDGFAFHRHITRISEFRLYPGLSVTVYESCMPSACDVVSGYWTTGLMNFVTGYTFGCAYPRLTLNNRALVCDTRVPWMGWSDYAIARRLASYGFETDRYPHKWALYARGPTSSTCPTIDGCGRSIYVCPQQGRFFGDPGSLVVFYDGLSIGLEGLRDLNVAPYGTMVTWRIPSSGPCTLNCLETDPAFIPFVVSIMSQFHEDGPKVPRPGLPGQFGTNLPTHAPDSSPPADHLPRHTSV